MSTDTDTEREYTPGQLRQMDEREARQTLTVDQFERWEKVQDLYDEAEDTREQWAAEAEEVEAITVRADPEKLGTHVDVFGNDLVVRVDADSQRFRDAAERLDEEFGDVAADETEEIDPDRADAMADQFLELLECVIVKWGDHEWADLPPGQQQATLQDAKAKWGLSGLFKAWVEIAEAIGDEREDLEATVESFRREGRAGRR